MSVAVVKIGVGNTASVMFALERLGARAVLTDEPARLADAERAILPGVGAARYAMERLQASGMSAALRAFKGPLLGICLGQQLLYEHSEEGDALGLGLLAGSVSKLPADTQTPSPHMGWSQLLDVREHPITAGLPREAYAYFVHSFACPLGEPTIATASHGRTFSAMVSRGNAYGCQFHPERSGAVGRRILENFLALPC